MLKGGAVSQSEASNHTTTKKTKDNNIIGAVLGKLQDVDFLLDCSFWALFALSTCGAVMFVKSINNETSAMLGKATNDFISGASEFIADTDQITLDEILLNVSKSLHEAASDPKVRDALRKVGGELKAIGAIVEGQDE